MSLIQSSFVLFSLISTVSCISSTSNGPSVAVTGREVLENNTLYHMIMAAMGRRFSKDLLDGMREKARVKKNTPNNLSEEVAKAARLPPLKLMTLTALVFNQVFSKGVRGKDPTLTHENAIAPFVKMIKDGFAAMKATLGKHHFE